MSDEYVIPPKGFVRAQQDRIDTLQAKLAVAIEALEEVAMQQSDLPMILHARKALEQIRVGK